MNSSFLFLHRRIPAYGKITFLPGLVCEWVKGGPGTLSATCASTLGPPQSPYLLSFVILFPHTGIIWPRRVSGIIFLAGSGNNLGGPTQPVRHMIPCATFHKGHWEAKNTSQESWVQLLALLPIAIILDKLYKLSEPRFSHPKNGNNVITYYRVFFFWRLKDITQKNIINCKELPKCYLLLL